MDNDGYKPRLVVILVFIIVIGQILSINYLKQDFEKKIAGCYEALNTSSVLQAALVNILVQKNVLERKDLLTEAQNLSVDLKKMIEETKMLEQQKAESPHDAQQGVASDLKNTEKKDF